MDRASHCWCQFTVKKKTSTSHFFLFYFTHIKSHGARCLAAPPDEGLRSQVPSVSIQGWRHEWVNELKNTSPETTPRAQKQKINVLVSSSLNA